MKQTNKTKKPVTGTAITLGVLGAGVCVALGVLVKSICTKKKRDRLHCGI